MKASQIEIGDVYLVNFGGEPQAVRVREAVVQKIADQVKRMWICDEMSTGKPCTVTDIQQFIGVATINLSQKTSDEVQQAYDNFCFEHGEFCHTTPNYAELLAEVGLKPEQITDEVRKRSERHIRQRLHGMFSKNQVANPKDETTITPPAQETKKEGATMQVSEQDARAVLNALGLKKTAQGLAVNRLEVKFNAKSFWQKAAAKCKPLEEGSNEAATFQSICDALEEGEKIEIKPSEAEEPQQEPQASEETKEESVVESNGKHTRAKPGKSKKGTAKPPKAEKKGKAGKPDKKPAKKTERSGMSGLDAAAKVLEEAGKPLNRMEILEAMETKGYWSSPKGKTPGDTIKAAIYTEIKKKGKKSRFKQVGRGLFSSK